MADFNSRLLDLIHAYHIDRHHPWFYEKVRAERLLKEFWAGWLEQHQGGTLILLYEKRGDLENFYMSMPDEVCHRAVRYRNDDMFSFAECIPQIRNGGGHGEYYADHTEGSCADQRGTGTRGAGGLGPV